MGGGGVRGERERVEEAARKDGKRGKGMVWRDGGRREEGTERERVVRREFQCAYTTIISYSTW